MPKNNLRPLNPLVPFQFTGSQLGSHPLNLDASTIKELEKVVEREVEQLRDWRTRPTDEKIAEEMRDLHHALNELDKHLDALDPYCKKQLHSHGATPKEAESMRSQIQKHIRATDRVLEKSTKRGRDPDDWYFLIEQVAESVHCREKILNQKFKLTKNKLEIIMDVVLQAIQIPGTKITARHSVDGAWADVQKHLQWIEEGGHQDLIDRA